MIKELIHYYRRLNGNADSLRKLGATIGNNFNNYGTVDGNHAYLFSCGDNCTIANEAMILCHDASTLNRLSYSKVGTVQFGDNVFVGARAIVMPNVTIGSNVIIGAGSVVTKSIESNSVVCGNPARKVDSYNNYIDRMRKKMNESNVFEIDWKHKSKKQKKCEYDLLKNGNIGFDK